MSSYFEPSAKAGGAASGAGLVAEPLEWTITHAPAVNTIATATKAAAAGVRHVIRSLLCSVTLAGAGGPLGGATLRVKDGATIIYQSSMSLTNVVGSIDRVELAGLNLVGTVGNGMTVDFDVAGGANIYEIVSASGYSI